MQVLANAAPYPPVDQVTHAFSKKRSSSSSSRSSGSSSSTPADLPAGIEWLRVEYLCAHLTGMGSAPRSDFLLQGEQGPAKRSRVSGR